MQCGFSAYMYLNIHISHRSSEALYNGRVHQELALHITIHGVKRNRVKFIYEISFKKVKCIIGKLFELDGLFFLSFDNLACASLHTKAHVRILQSFCRWCRSSTQARTCMHQASYHIINLHVDSRRRVDRSLHVLVQDAARLAYSLSRLIFCIYIKEGCSLLVLYSNTN
jgi:hypothetical protein